MKKNVERKNKKFEAYGYEKFDFESIYNEYKEYAKILKPYVCDTVRMLHEAIDKDEYILCEGAQATLLDIDHGTYPFVTSSNPTAGGACIGTGIGPGYFNNIYGVIKAYSSRVGEGPYVTELNNELGDRIRELGHEYGTTTKRPRRCGWLDLVALKYAIKVNYINGICMNHLDTLGKLEEPKLCVAYEIDGERVEYFSSNLKLLEKAKPIYEKFEGNYGDISNCKTFEELPRQAQEYVNRVEELTKTKVKMIGTGPGRNNIIIR